MAERGVEGGSRVRREYKCSRGVTIPLLVARKGWVSYGLIGREIISDAMRADAAATTSNHRKSSTSLSLRSVSYLSSPLSSLPILFALPSFPPFFLPFFLSPFAFSSRDRLLSRGSYRFSRLEGGKKPRSIRAPSPDTPFPFISFVIDSAVSR